MVFCPKVNPRQTLQEVTGHRSVSPVCVFLMATPMVFAIPKLATEYYEWVECTLPIFATPVVFAIIPKYIDIDQLSGPRSLSKQSYQISHVAIQYHAKVLSV
jgi:hypothetical protein